ncbi:MAG TPA: S8 family serine peptidase, partial [Pyrinomonadaceae bacterium]|nr:S8 family serine peptidase [Pyrinomonadaceae bacterium]
MNRQNFIGHLALALTVILLAAVAGQIRHWHNEQRDVPPEEAAPSLSDNSADEESNDNDEDSNESEVLVRFKPGTSVETIKSIAAQHNDEVEDEIEAVNGLAVIEDEDGLDAESVAAEYRSMTDLVEYAEPNYEIKLEPELSVSQQQSAPRELDRFVPDNWPNDPQFADQWSLENTGQRGGKARADIRALEAWKKTKGSNEVVVAVLDTGVDYTHPDLKNNIWTRPATVPKYVDDDLGELDDVHGYSAFQDDDDSTDKSDPMDDNGHGTHCAGIIGAEGDNNFGITGVNWHVQIMPLKFMDANGSGTTKDAIEAINYVIDRKRHGVNVRIISASWGSTMKSKALEDVIKKAGDEGIEFIAAAGNSSDNSDKRPHYPAGFDLPNVISVAALDRFDQLASFSNYGA